MQSSNILAGRPRGGLLSPPQATLMPNSLEKSDVEQPSRKSKTLAPTVSLPKGGGAITGIGEKFAANPVTGTGSITVPLPTSPGRSGFGPQLSLAYDSGAGNGPFGFGWSLSLPTITRKTDKGLPQYRDAEESDIFILSGAEDLVPVLQPNGKRFKDSTPAPGYTIQRYRPRIEGLFSRIERWTNATTGEIHWRSISRDNITTLYGLTAESRVSDPDDPKRVFSWLICQTYDDKGNAIVFTYEEENSNGVALSQANERNRTAKSRSANRYLKRIKYGNVDSHLVQPNLAATRWMFEVVFDYDDGHYEEIDLDPRRPPVEQHRRVRAAGAGNGSWDVRPDVFSIHRAGFEVRTYRRCRRVLMFHRFSELGSEPCLVRSIEFDYADLDYSQRITIEGELSHQGSTRFASFIRAVTQSGFVRDETQPILVRDGYITYLRKSLPPLEFEYSKAVIQDDIRDLNVTSLENIPVGLDGANYQWVDLDGEGVSGMLTEQAGAWFYKPNLGDGRFGPLEMVRLKPSLADLSGGRQQLIDLAGDGQLDLVAFAGSSPGFYERTQDEDWEPFKTFGRLPNIRWDEPNMRFVDLNGDGHADVLITENEALTWYPSLAEEGFDSARSVRKPFDEEKGPRLVLADATQSVYLADMCGDGLTDLVRIRNGEVCYWPNLGYGRFGAKVTMDNSPWFDNPDQFNHQRVRVADIDGSGTSDIIYLGLDGVRLYFNQSGNQWSAPRRLNQFPRVDNLSSVTTADLLGNGTAALVWSSPLPADARRPLRYIDLMGGQKPHLLVKTINNLGAETVIHYASSTRFYLADKAAGTPWITKIPFPVHTVERVEVFDRISRNHFVTRYAYHHGHFDGVEREFRGFGMVEQWDTGEFASLRAGGSNPLATNIDEASHLPPVLTRTWFHTGAYIDAERISGQFEKEYYRESGGTDADAHEMLLGDTILPEGLRGEEEQEAVRALKGSMMRQEVYALDGTNKQNHPYTVTEQNFAIKRVQPKSGNRHAVFFTHALEAISCHYERNPADPRISHELTLEVDEFGSVLRSIAVGYSRANVPDRQPEQNETHLTLTLNRFANRNDEPDWQRIGLPVETRTYEVVKPPPTSLRFAWEELRDLVESLVPLDQVEPPTAKVIPYEQWDWRRQWNPQTEPGGTAHTRLRLIEHVRTLYRPDDLGVARNDPLALLPLGRVESLALAGESYKLAFTSGLLAHLYQGPLDFIQPPRSPPRENLLPNPTNVLGARGDDRGGYVDLDHNGNWWIPSGRMFYSAHPTDTSALELVEARTHFFLPRRYRDPFHIDLVKTETLVSYDDYDLLIRETRDALGNRTTVGERNLDPTQPLLRHGQDYRVLQPALVMGPNRNRSGVAFDALGMVVGTAIMGKPEEIPGRGDSLDFEPDLTASVTGEHVQHPLADPHAILRRATTRLVYDPFAYQRTKDQVKPKSAVVYTLTRETHDADLEPGQQTKIQHSFSYSDGFGREIQKKIQAERGKVPRRDPSTGAIITINGQPEMTPNDVSPRWVGSGWTVFNNKGKPVRQYEPFFTDTHDFEFDVRIGVSPVLFYDPLGRVVATLHPNHTWEKVVFDPWKQTTFDVNDNVSTVDPPGDLNPRNDLDVGDFFRRLPDGEYLPTWYAPRQAGVLGPQEQAAAGRAAIHANTPTAAFFDSLGRTCLTIAHNRFKRGDSPLDDPPTEEFYRSRTVYDLEGNQREVIDAKLDATEKGRVVMRYDYDMLSNRVHQASVEAGERWTLNDVTGKPIRAWDSRDHRLRTAYDQLRRPIEVYMGEGIAGGELLVGRTIYGETLPDPETNNLREKVVEVFDQAGVVSSDEYDFKGNLLRSRRQLAQDYNATLNWSASILLEEEDIYTSRTRYDALNRPIQLIAPHSNRPGTKINVIQPFYNEANLLEQVHGWLNQNDEPAGLLLPGTANLHAVTDIDYDAKGQRKLIDYGNGVRTTYEYDPLTFRLVHLLTQRDAIGFPDDCPNPSPAGWPGCQVQNLHYTYDPAGNITHIRDDAQQTVYFRNRRVEPSAEYTYDATYRLIEATGREHLGQTGGAPNAPTAPDAFNNFHTRLEHRADGNAMGTYVERYVYDAVGNILAMQHRGSDPAHSGWTRAYTYNEASQLETGRVSNRLSSTTIGSITEPYHYSGPAGLHGNITSMPHLPLMQWDYRDQLQATAQQVVTDGTPETTWYVYDSGGQRVRKVTARALTAVDVAARRTPTRMKERIYLGGFEIYREYASHGTSVALERETLHIMDDKRRIALVETKTIDAASPAFIPTPLICYQISNHLGSSSLELDRAGEIISYEEYFPYGSTSYQAVGSGVEVSPKRYRYTGKERDDESGLCYHLARYYAPWLARWTAGDPSGTLDGLNLYAYVGGNPIRLRDPSGRNGEDTQLNFSQSRPFSQRVTATATGRGINSTTRANLRRAYVYFGGSPDELLHAGHRSSAGGEVPFVLTPAGTDSSVSPQRGSENTRLASTERAQATAARARGEFARDTSGRDTTVPLGTRYGQPPENPNFSTIPPLQVSWGRPAPVVPPNSAPTHGPVGEQLSLSFSSATSRAPAPGARGEQLCLSLPANSSTNHRAPAPGARGEQLNLPFAPNSSNRVTTPPRATVGNIALDATRTVVPLVAEAEAALQGGAQVAYGLRFASTGATLETAASFVPVVGAGAMVGAVSGNVVQSGIRNVGGSRDDGLIGGAWAATASGAAVGALIGSAGAGVLSAPGAVIGAVAGWGAYMISNF